MTKETESRTVQITVLITPSEKAALDAAKDKWNRSLGSEVHGRIAYTLAMGEDVDFLDGKDVQREPNELYSQFEEYRRMLIDEISGHIGDIPYPSDMPKIDLSDVEDIAAFQSAVMEQIVQDTDIEFEDKDFFRMSEMNFFKPPEPGDEELYSTVMESFAEAAQTAMKDHPNPDTLSAKRTFSRLDRASDLLQKWGLAYLLLSTARIRFRYVRELDKKLTATGLQEADTAVKRLIMAYHSDAENVRTQYAALVEGLKDVAPVFKSLS